MTFEEFKLLVIKSAEALSLSEYELYYESVEGTSVSVFAHEVSEFSSEVSGGVSFRCIVGGRMGYASTEELSEAEASDIVRRAAENAEILETEDKEFLAEGGKEYSSFEHKEPNLPTTEELVEIALRGHEATYAADGAVIDGTSTTAASEVYKIAITNSKGLDLSYENKIAVFMTDAVVTDGAEMANETVIKAGELSEPELEKKISEAVGEAKAKLGADVAPTGEYPVVFSPKAMASFLRVYSKAFSSGEAQKGLSPLAGMEGTKIASDIVTIVDDPFYRDSLMPINFDSEGTPAYKKNVVENGELKTLLYNLKTAASAGVETTGNASRSGYDASVEISPFTMYIAPGSVTEEELLSMAGNGVYIDSLGGLHTGANTISGDFSLQSAGYMIENGVKGKAVKSFTVAGNFYEMLKHITAISDEVKLPGFGGITAFGSPAVLADGLTIAGK